MSINIINDINKIKSERQPINIIKDINNNKSLQQSSPSSNNLYMNTITNILKGAAYEALRTPVGALRAAGINATNPLENLNNDKSIAFNYVGRPIGGIGSTAAALYGLSRIPGAAAIPLIPRALSALSKAKGIIPTMAKGALGGAAYEATADYDDRLRGALQGAAGGLGAGALYGLGKGLAGGISLLKNSPVKQADKIIQNISGGEPKNLQSSTIDLTNKILNDYKNIEKVSKERWSPILEKVGNKKIKYTQLEEMGKSKIEDKGLIDYFGIESKEKYSDFIKSPTFDNAKKFRTAMGREIGDYRGKPEYADRVYALRKARGILLDDMNKFIDKKYPSLKGKYENAIEHYREDFAPYEENRILNAIGHGAKTNITPEELRSLFKFPGSKIEKVIKENPSILKVSENLGDKYLDKLLFSTSLHKQVGKMKPEELITAVNNLSKEGLNTYITPSFKSQMLSLEDSLQKMALLKKNLRYAGMGLGGIGGLFGLNELRKYIPYVGGH